MARSNSLLLPSKPAPWIQQPGPAKAKQKESAALDEDVQEIDLAHHQQRVVSRLFDRVGSIPDDREGEEDEDEDNGERDIEFVGTVDGEADSPTMKTKTKTKKKKKARSQSNRTKSVSPRTREVTSPTSSPTRDNISSPFHLQSPLSDVASRPAKANTKNVGFAGVCEDDATSTKWKLVLDKTKAAGSGQVSCECFFVLHPSWALFALSSV